MNPIRGTRPDVSENVATEPIGCAGSNRREFPHIFERRSVRIYIESEHALWRPRVGDVEYAFIRRETQAVRTVHPVNDDANVSGFGIEAKDKVTIEIRFAFFTFPIGEDTVRRVGKPDTAVRLHDKIVWGVKSLAVDVVDERGDGAVVLCSRDAVRQVLCAYKATLVVGRITVREVGWFPKYRGLPVCGIKFQHSIIGNVRPHHHIIPREVDGALRPFGAAPVASQFRTFRNERVETWIE